jgi:hypothetical protein
MPFTNRGAFSACEWPDRARPEELIYITGTTGYRRDKHFTAANGSA